MKVNTVTSMKKERKEAATKGKNGPTKKEIRFVHPTFHGGEENEAEKMDFIHFREMNRRC